MGTSYCGFREHHIRALPNDLSGFAIDLEICFRKNNLWEIEGRIDEDGNLQCSYHGWSFNGCESCPKIPQASPQGPEARAVGSPRACATRFPTKVSHGLLFVWPEENGWEKANAAKPPTVVCSMGMTLSWRMSLIPLTDFAHHTVTGRRDRAKPLPFKLESRGPWGFAGANDGNPRIMPNLLLHAII
ncbi:hypothetical protein L6164_019031 [Bauhinia variegata]|uniref:Uncharacterized protein n=1 Tax=Bauhinia variegata TaxID=167791 RepID=A0ACB9NEG2_BAUVA|nr:hypothetical protein L6164_019031 [Bauhinia variegata]